MQSQENDTDGYLTYHFNNVGSTMAVTNQKGEAVKEYAYSPYGELLFGEHDESIQFLYNGQYGVTTDSNGLYYMRARYYNVDIKRFVNQDVLTGTLERISSLNRYSYVEGNPVSFLDPFGLEPYDTTNMHDTASLIGLAAFVISLVYPSGGIIVATAANGFDIGLYFYDSVYDIRGGDRKQLLSNIGNILIDLIGILTAGISNGFLKSAQEAAAFNGIMGGYEQELIMLYDKWKNYDDIVGKGTTGFEVLKRFISYLKEIWKDEKEE